MGWLLLSSRRAWDRVNDPHEGRLVKNPEHCSLREIISEEDKRAFEAGETYLCCIFDSQFFVGCCFWRSEADGTLSGFGGSQNWESWTPVPSATPYLKFHAGSFYFFPSEEFSTELLIHMDTNL